MRFPKNDDLKLARRAADGDAQALEAIYARYADALYAYVAHRLGGPREDIEDVWQDTLLAMLKSLPAYDGRSRFFTWLCGIAGHKIADHLRRQGKSQETTFADLPSQSLLELADDGPLPDDLLENRAVSARVVQALGILPDEYRRALVMRYADQLGVEEVAKAIGRGYKATESLLARARSAFRAELLETEELP
jgi:RNA polymerase sigma-70 factor (ECF subfamily)